jgi:hypothetical protein
MLIELHAGRSVVDKKDVDLGSIAERLNLVVRVVGLRTALEKPRRPLVVRCCEAAAHAPDAHRSPGLADVRRPSVVQVEETRQHFVLVG